MVLGRRWKNLAVFTAVLGFAPMTGAAIPEPSAIVFGEVELDGFPLGTGGIVEARFGNTPIATYSIGSAPAGGQLYYLEIPLESLDDGGTPTSGVLRVGDSISIFINGIDSGASVLVSERAAVSRIDLAGSVSSNPDIDGDGVANWLDNCGGISNPGQIDANNNGIGDDCEAQVNPTPQFAAITDIANPPDAETGFGQVDYEYSLGNTEVTNAQYRDFLEAVATADDPNGLYNLEMGTNPRGGIIQVGSAPGLGYRVRPNMADKPVNFVSWLDAARYSNWKENGEPSGAQGPSTTETGAFDLTVAAPEINSALSLAAGTRLPEENEWYKAAYYDPFADIYDDYPTRSSDPALPQLALATSIGVVSNGQLGGDVTNYDGGAQWAAQVGNVTSVTTTLSPSAYETYDQGGNVREWLGNDAENNMRVARGGSFGGSVDELRKNSGSTNRLDVLLDPLYEGADVGFRIFMPEPGFAFSLASGITLLGLRARSRHRARN